MKASPKDASSIVSAFVTDTTFAAAAADYATIITLPAPTATAATIATTMATPGVPTTKNDDVQVGDSISHTHIILGTSDEESSAAILSAVIGSIFGLIALLITIVIIVFARRRKHKLQQRNHDATSIEMATSRNAERASKRESSPTAEVSLTRALSFEPPRKVGQDERPAGHGAPRSPSCTVRVLEDR